MCWPFVFCLDVLGLRSVQVVPNGTLHGAAHVTLVQSFQDRQREGRRWRPYLLQAFLVLWGVALPEGGVQGVLVAFDLLRDGYDPWELFSSS